MEGVFWLVRSEINELIGTAVAADVHLILFFSIWNLQKDLIWALFYLWFCWLSNVGHKYLRWVIFVYENISINKFYAVFKYFNFDVEDGRQIGKCLVFIYELCEIGCFLIVDEKTSHQEYKNNI